MAKAMKKPCNLQLNNSGAWKTVVTFDSDDKKSVQAVETAAELLATVDEGLRMRIATAGAHAEPLMYLEHGLWRNA